MAAKSSMSINLGLASVPEVETPELYGALMPVYNAIKNVMYAVDSYTGNAQIDSSEFADINYISQLSVQKISTVFATLTEDVSAGTTINFHKSGGLAARKALTTSKPCQGIALVTGVIGDVIPVLLFGLCANIGGLAEGAVYYQSSSVAGQITATSTTQKLGFALGPNYLWFSPS